MGALCEISKVDESVIKNKIESLTKLGKWILEKPDELELAKLRSKRDNPWFDLISQQKALNAIAAGMLEKGKLENWLSKYDLDQSSNKIVGLIPAGNIPVVGFHDLLCIYVSGHQAHIKLSDKDAHLMPAIFTKLKELDSDVEERIQFVDKLNDIEALIATGSDNSKRYFEYYFGHLPHIIRGNRNSLAIISNDITEEELHLLGHDVFDYYGLGCRSVSQVLIPEGFNENKLLDAWHDYKYVMDNDKYENNYQYNYAIFILNQETFKTNNFIILKESVQMASRIACLHYKRYANRKDVTQYLDKHKNNIQLCVTDISDLDTEIPTVSPGESQIPGPSDYADRIDTLEFLNNLS